MTGERFSPEELQPKKVLLKAKAHGVAAASNLAEIFSGSSKLTIMSRGPNPNSKVRPLYVNGLSLLETAKFCEFLTKVIEQKVSVSVQAIVYQNDEASRIIAQECARQLQVLTGSENPLEIISQDELDNEGQSLDRRRALLIVAAVVGHGSKLLSISRDLRALHTGARTYLIGVQISESQAQITALRRNLEQSATKAQISVETFSSLSVGAGLVDSYIEEHEFVKTLPEDIKNGPLTARLNVLPGDRTGLNESAFLPTGQNLTENLKLRPDFAFWNFSYKEEQIHVPAVFATAAAILQHARESVSLAPENRLSSDAFQQVVLDPENFARFNDGVIQASLLRAAHRSELDYSSERNASQYMLALLMKILTQHGKPQGEAALEFALALSSGRLRIMTEHLVELKQNIAPALEGNSLLKQTLRVYLRLDNAPDEHAFPADF